MMPGDPGQVKGKDLDRLKRFATGFNKYLNYRYRWDKVDNVAFVAQKSLLRLGDEIVRGDFKNGERGQRGGGLPLAQASKSLK